MIDLFEKIQPWGWQSVFYYGLCGVLGYIQCFYLFPKIGEKLSDFFSQKNLCKKDILLFEEWHNRAAWGSCSLRWGSLYALLFVVVFHNHSIVSWPARETRGLLSASSRTR